jgi:hypothetical protein
MLAAQTNILNDFMWVFVWNNQWMECVLTNHSDEFQCLGHDVRNGEC